MAIQISTNSVKNFILNFFIFIKTLIYTIKTLVDIVKTIIHAIKTFVDTIKTIIHAIKTFVDIVKTLIYLSSMTAQY